MKNQKIIVVCMLMFVSLTLVGCSEQPQVTNTVTDDTLLAQQIIDAEQEIIDAEQELIEREQDLIEREQEIIEEEKQIIEQEEAVIKAEQEILEEVPAIATYTASEIIYAAQKGNSVEAHPAWMTLSVTLNGDIITAINLQQQSSSPKSARHQAQFAQQVEGIVVGKTLSESDTIYLSVASTSSQTFNDSIEEIQALYQQTQG